MVEILHCSRFFDLLYLYSTLRNKSSSLSGSSKSRLDASTAGVGEIVLRVTSELHYGSKQAARQGPTMASDVFLRPSPKPPWLLQGKRRKPKTADTELPEKHATAHPSTNENKKTKSHEQPQNNTRNRKRHIHRPTRTDKTKTHKQQATQQQHDTFRQKQPKQEQSEQQQQYIQPRRKCQRTAHAETGTSTDFE
jgi:hypothetical protein